MNTNRRFTSTTLRCSALLTALLLALPMAVSAQSAPASSSSSASIDMGSMPGMDHGSMAGMSMPASPSSAATPATPETTAHKHVQKSAAPAKTKRDTPGMNHGAMSGMTPPAKSASSGDMQGMDHTTMPGMSPDTMKGMDHESMPGMNHGAAPSTDSMAGMTMGPMQGGSAPPNARSPDYSDGIGYGPMKGMDMLDNASLGMLRIDQLEAFHGKDGNGQTWEAQGWYGNDTDKLWLRTEGDRSRGKIEDGDVEAFWNRNVATYWSTQLGVRHELGDGPGRNWVAFGVQGLAPYWFELEATGYVGPSGRTAARLRAEYELLFTQRLILQPEF